MTVICHETTSAHRKCPKQPRGACRPPFVGHTWHEAPALSSQGHDNNLALDS